MDPTAILEISLIPSISNEESNIINDKFFNLKILMERELMKEVDYISLALKLFKLGSVFIHKIERTSESLIQRGKSISNYFREIANRVRYGIEKSVVIYEIFSIFNKE